MLIVVYLGIIMNTKSRVISIFTVLPSRDYQPYLQAIIHLYIKYYITYIYYMRFAGCLIVYYNIYVLQLCIISFHSFRVWNLHNRGRHQQHEFRDYNTYNSINGCIYRSYNAILPFTVACLFLLKLPLRLHALSVVVAIVVKRS